MKLLSLFFVLTFMLVGCKHTQRNKTQYNVLTENKNNDIFFSANNTSKAKELEESQADTYQIGRKEAAEDISNEKLFIKTKGDPTNVVFEWEKILKEKYGVQMFHFGCCYSDKVDKYVKGYNEISETEIKKRFGKRFLNDTLKEAKQKISN